MKKEAVIINVTINNEVYTVSYESGTVRTYKKVTKPISAWLEAHSNQSQEEMVEDVTEDVTENVTEDVTENVTEDVTDDVTEEQTETALVVVEPAEIVTMDEAEEVTEETAEIVEVVTEESTETTPIIRWEDLVETAKTVARAIATAGKTAAPVAKAGCIALWNILRVVILSLISFAKTVRLYGPDIIADVVTDVQILYYKGKALYFQTKMVARASVRAARRARKTAKRMARVARLATWKATGTAMEVAKMVMAPIMAATVVAVMMAVKASVKMAKVAVDGWNMREELKREERA